MSRRNPEILQLLQKPSDIAPTEERVTGEEGREGGREGGERWEGGREGG